MMFFLMAYNLFTYHTNIDFKRKNVIEKQFPEAIT